MLVSLRFQTNTSPPLPLFLLLFWRLSQEGTRHENIRNSCLFFLPRRYVHVFFYKFLSFCLLSLHPFDDCICRNFRLNPIRSSFLALGNGFVVVEHASNSVILLNFNNLGNQNAWFILRIETAVSYIFFLSLSLSYFLLAKPIFHHTVHRMLSTYIEHSTLMSFLL